MRGLTVLALLLSSGVLAVLAYRAMGEGDFGLTVLFGMPAVACSAGATHILRNRD